MSLPLLRLHYLDLLRGFVAVGRRMSITLAAQDLCLTQSAISRQVNALEQALGCKLFVRGHRSIQFTEPGARLFRAADGAVQQLQDVLGAMTGSTERRPVTITASIGTTALWLLPRLGQFQRRHPGIDLRVATSNKISDLVADGLDIAIRYCARDAVPKDASHLFDELFVPVAHPSLGIGGRGLAAAIGEHVLISYDDPQRGWFQWREVLAAYGLAHLKPRGFLRFNQYDQVIQACVAGQGIAMGQFALIESMLQEQRLQAVDQPWRSAAQARGFWLLQRAGIDGSDAATVTAWLQRQAATTRRRMARLRRDVVA